MTSQNRVDYESRCRPAADPGPDPTAIVPVSQPRPSLCNNKSSRFLDRTSAIETLEYYIPLPFRFSRLILVQLLFCRGYGTAVSLRSFADSVDRLRGHASRKNVDLYYVVIAKAMADNLKQISTQPQV